MKDVPHYLELFCRLFLLSSTFLWGFPGGLDSKDSICNTGDLGSIPGSGRSPGERNGYPTPVFLPGESHRQRNLVGYSPWGHRESDMTEHAPAERTQTSSNNMNTSDQTLVPKHC